MSYFINPIENERCVCVSFEGELPPREVAATLYEAHGVLNARGWTRVMVDITQWQSVPTAQQLFDFTKILSGQVSCKAHVALVVRPEQVRYADLVEKVVRKAGVFLAYFLDPEKATIWVRQAGASFRRKPQPQTAYATQASL